MPCLHILLPNKNSLPGLMPSSFDDALEYFRAVTRVRENPRGMSAWPAATKMGSNLKICKRSQNMLDSGIYLC
jgi:hypothetical protein